MEGNVKVLLGREERVGEYIEVQVEY